MRKLIICLLLGFVFISCFGQKKEEVNSKTEEPTKPEVTEVWEPIPPIVTPGKNNEPPSDALVLFDGTDFNQWVQASDSSSVKWILDKEDKSFTVKDKTGDIQTKKNFGSVQLHIEWRSSPEVKGSGQHRSNSGVFLQNRYEIQILDNNDNGTYVNGQVGAIYKQSIPLVKASSKTGEWNTYDIIYHAPEFDSAGNKVKSATITALHNGVLILDHFEIKGTTEYIGSPKNNAHGKAPIKLQDHRDDSGVSYRNIWVRELN